MPATSGTFRIPIATYRLQFNARFTFSQARDLVDYLDQLGISDCYASSYLKAVPASPHGYDVADPTQLNPEIGSDEDYWSWIAALKARDMGHVLDVVPNHMGIAKSSNPWWLDVLENGPSSRYARFFDIEWHPVKRELADKVLLPILGDQYGAVLERQELVLTYRDGSFAVRYYEETLPIAPDTFGVILGHRLDELLARNPSVDAGDVDELRSVISSAGHLPPRSTRDPNQIVVRARENEVIKRRIAGLLDRSPALAQLVEETVRAFNGTAGQPRSFDPLDRLLNEQSYRLAHWRVASEEINYRRFFDVNQLAALRMEDPEVFDSVHRFTLELVAKRAATGLRIDHVDGLYAPEDYLVRLQRKSAEAMGVDASEQRPLFIVVEKILGADEQLPPWPIAGTTGYEFAAIVNNLFVDRKHERAIDAIYTRYVRSAASSMPFDELVYQSKKLILHETMSGDINSLGHQLNRFSEANRHFRDFTLYSLISSLKELIASFPVYRTYITANGDVSDHDRRYITRAVAMARRRAPGVAALVYNFLERLLLKQTAVSGAAECEARARFIGKLQQITGPVAAKGIEDTALYVYNRLVSLNDVGSDPTQFGLDAATVHRWMGDRQRRWPAALSATSTHDSKRGEDLRARLDVISEVPESWRSALTRWRALNRRFKREVAGVPVPDANEEYLLYQTLLGAWPFARTVDAEFKERIKTYMTKALREAKQHTGWLSPDEEYERGVVGFIDAVLDPKRPFVDAFLPFQERIAEWGIYNSLAQLVIKITAPGVPDCYQGTELWDLSLVDPDNRRPVDYGLRRSMLAQLTAAGSARPGGSDSDLSQFTNALLDTRADGRIKMWTMHAALCARRAMRAVFESGSYEALESHGSRRDCVFAFARHEAGGDAIVAVPRLIAALTPAGGPPLGAETWEDTTIALPSHLGGRVLQNIFTGELAQLSQDGNGVSMSAASVFGRFPVALFVSAHGAHA